MISRNGEVWWNGYQGEEVILFDDFRGEVNFSAVLTMTHEYRETVQTKGGVVEVNASYYIFTSNEPWTMWDSWKGYDKTPWERRVTDHFVMSWGKDENGLLCPEATVIKGSFGEFDDPPKDGGDEPLTDEQVEDVLAIPPTSKWLPQRKRAAFSELGPPLLPVRRMNEDPFGLGGVNP